ncbi:hypothetical protein ACQPWW_20560 [Micromonospora sp. CA-240977]|uniref:hypothetical protein n=1 Tax=Micromonospora sp. CA-240977 TaxID=3239957 RepID=UPI003D93F275
MVTLVVVTPATPAVIGIAGGQVGDGVGVEVGDGVDVEVGDGVDVGMGVDSAVPAAPPARASATVVAARKMRSIGTSGGYRAPMTKVGDGAALGFPVPDEGCPARVT